MYLGDCTQHRFPNDYAHVNGLQEYDGDIIASFRGCSQMLRIDGATGDVVWRLGRSNRSDADWEAMNTPAPLKIVGDPYGEFCGQHPGRMLPNGNLLVYDNGAHCVVELESGRRETSRPQNEFSRVVEYEIDVEAGEARFVRHHSYKNAFNRFSVAQGHAEAIDNGSWLISWGRGYIDQDPNTALPHEKSLTEYNPGTDQELLSIKLSTQTTNEVASPTRAYPLKFEALAKAPAPPAAEFPASSHTDLFKRNATDPLTVVVAFNQPVVDFAATTPSLSATGATITSVSPHVAAGEPANAYLVTLTPTGAGQVTLRLLAGRACASGGVCTAAGATLAEVPAPYTSSAPVTVSFREASVVVKEGNKAALVVTLSAAHRGPFELAIPIAATAGAGVSDTEFSAPSVVAFAAGETEQTVLVATSADADPEPDETVSFAFGALPPGVSAGAVATATVTIEDDDSLVLSLGNITQTGAEAMVSIPSPTGQSRTVHLRYRITTPPGAWSTTQTASTTTSSAMFDVTGLTSGTEYQIEVSLDSHFATGVTSATFTTLPPAVESLSVGSITRTGAAVTVNVIAANDSGVHLRYRKGTDTWTRKSQFVRAGETSATITLSGLSSGRGYTVEASYDREFPTATTESARFTTAPPSVDSVSVAKVSQTGAAVTVGVVAPNGDDVHLRYRIGGDDWSTESADVNIGATSAAFPLSGLTSGADYEVEASYDAAFPAGHDQVHQLHHPAPEPVRCQRGERHPDRGHRHGRHRRAQRRIADRPPALPHHHAARSLERDPDD